MTIESYWKNKDLIEAWANGAKIEWYSNMTKDWKADKYPNWHEQLKYRIKPKQTIAEWLEENNSDYVPSWNNYEQDKYYIYKINTKWYWFHTVDSRIYNTVYMPLNTAMKLVDLLNKGEVIEG